MRGHTSEQEITVDSRHGASEWRVGWWGEGWGGEEREGRCRINLLDGQVFRLCLGVPVVLWAPVSAIKHV